VLPPVRYPDGSFYLKIGGGFVDAVLNTIEDFRSWFHSDGSAATAEQLKELLQSMLPELKPLSYTTLPCVVARTESGRPYIDTLDSGKIFLAAGGCGTAAKSADEIGRLAALLTETESWHDDLQADYFSRQFLNATEQLCNYNSTEPSCAAGLNPQANSACEG
jgi:glycine/D-amino acid oxidase-like deaminating enzyme